MNARVLAGLNYPLCSPEGESSGAGAAGAAPQAAAPVAPAKDWEAEFKAADKARAKLEKQHGELSEQFKQTTTVLDGLRKALNGGDEKADPLAKATEAIENANKAQLIAKNAVVKASAMQAAIAAGVKTERIPHAIRNADFSAAEVDLGAGVVTNANDVFNAAFTSLKTELPEWFVQPEAPKGGPAPQTSAPPKAPAPQNAPPAGRIVGLDEFRKLNPKEQDEQLARLRAARR